MRKGAALSPLTHPLSLLRLNLHTQAWQQVAFARASGDARPPLPFPLPVGCRVKEHDGACLCVCAYEDTQRFPQAACTCAHETHAPRPLTSQRSYKGSTGDTATPLSITERYLHESSSRGTCFLNAPKIRTSRRQPQNQRATRQTTGRVREAPVDRDTK